MSSHDGNPDFPEDFEPPFKNSGQKAPVIQIRVRTMVGEEYKLMVNRSWNIGRVKSLLYRLTGLRPEQQILIYARRVLNNDELTVREYNIRNGAVLRLQAKLSTGFNYQ